MNPTEQDLISWPAGMRREIKDAILRHIQPIGGTERARLLEIAPGHSKMTLDIKKESLNLYGNLHGGFLFSLCDIAAGMAVYAYEVKNVTQNSSIQFLKGISQGRIYIEANAVHKGKCTAVTEVKITDEEGAVLVVGMFSMFLMEKV